MSNSNIRANRQFGRRILLSTTAVVWLAAAGTASAQTADKVGPELAVDVAHGNSGNVAVAPLGERSGSIDLSSVSQITSDLPRAVEFAIETPQIVVEGPGEGSTLNPGQPGSIFDNAVNVTGVGQFYRADGFVCTGTLINPRTVLFAAHCVNNVEADAFGASTGGIPAAFAFGADALPGLQSWLRAGFQSNPDAFVYNIEQMIYNQQSLERPEAQGFLEADIALAALDTPASNVPAWAVLFSPLPTPESITSADGTGYHVTVNGYGRSGYGQNGSFQNTDFRRRAAENVIGALASLNDRNDWLFGPGDYGLPQNLYQTDFDDPNRQNIFDFNLFKDDARDPEGSSAGGDSGGPLILDEAYARKLVIGVLSGGSRFFNGQPDSSYGSSSLYQPLYLYWDWIAANSPYRYTQTKAGDGDWGDASHWVTALDPNFYVIDENGALVNGVPAEAGAGIDGTQPKFGQVCDGQFCLDLATGDIVDYEDNIILPGNPDTDPEGRAVNSNSIGQVAPLERLAEARRELGLAAADAGTLAIAPTDANGLPGGSGFVPNNQNFAPETADSARVNARYYDVTLAQAGTTSLGMDVTIDKFMIAGADAALNITSAGSLTSLVDVTQMAGRMNVDGTLATNGDYLLFTGALTGNGTITTPFFTNMMGVVAPGTMGTIGTLTFNGNVILTSGSAYSVDVGPNGASDLIQINATQFDDDDNPLDGMASIGGTVVINPVGQGLVRFGDSYTILRAQGGYEGSFQSPDISAILRPDFTYGANAVTLSITAVPYASVVDGSSPVQTAFAALLDRNRAQYGRYSDLYGPLDLQSAGAIQASLETFAPREQALKGAMGLAAVNVGNRIIRDRLAQLGASNDMGGTLSVVGQPQRAFAALSPDRSHAVDAADSYDRDGMLPDDVSGFLAGGYIEGDAPGMRTATPTGKNQFDGFYIAGGLEKAIENGAIGIALSYTDLDGETIVPTHSATGKLIQGSLYGVSSFAGLRLDTQVNFGAFDTNTRRAVSAGSTAFDIRGDDTAFTFSAETGLGKVFTAGNFDLTPRIALRAATIDYTRVDESGGGPALSYDLDSYRSFQGRAGFNLAGKAGFRPFLNANYVHDFEDRPTAFAANFVGGVGAPVAFALSGTDQDWAEVSGGVGYQAGNIGLSIAAETTIWRDDVSYQSYHGTVSFRF